MPNLRVDNLHVGVSGRLLVVGVSLIVEGGTAAVIRGPSGGGKSTLLKAIAGLLPIQGAVTFDDVPLERCAWVPQEPSLWSHWTLEENVQFAARMAGGFSTREAAAFANRLLEEVDLSEQRRQYPASLSGGELRRGALARALATRAGVLLLDETTASLDPIRKERAFSAVASHLREGGCALIATHEQEDFRPAFRCKSFSLVSGRLEEEHASQFRKV